MKRHLFERAVALLCVFVLLLGVSCSDESGTAAMKLLLRKTELGVKTLVPQDTASLQITRYRVNGSGPNNAVFEVSTDSASVTINGLEVGSWHVTATGLNAQGVALIRGSADCELSQNSGTVQITLDQMVGTGTLNLTVDWENTEVPDPNIRLYIRSQGGEESQLEISPDYANRRVTLSTELAAGSYVVRGVLMSGDFHVGGFVESIRIVGGQTTTGNLSIMQMQYADASGYFLLNNRSSVPVRGTLTGFTFSDDTCQLQANTDNQVTFTLDDEFEASPGLKIQWFIDGQACGAAATLEKTNTKTVNVTAGSHRIDAVVSNSLQGSLGCVSASFLAISGGQSGTICKISEFSTILIGKTGSSCTYLELGSDTMVSALPGGRFLVVSPSAGKIAVMKVTRNYLDLVSVYGTEDFPFIGSITMVKSHPVLPWIITLDNYGGTENVTFMRYDQDNGTIAMCTGDLARITGTFTIPGSSVSAQISEVRALDFSPSDNMAYVLANRTVLNGTTVSHRILWFRMSTGSPVLGGFSTIPEDFTADCRMAISPSGGVVALTAADKTEIYLAQRSQTGAVQSFRKIGSTTSVPAAVALGSDGCLTVSNGSLENFVFSIGAIGINQTAYVTPQTVQLTADQLLYNSQSTYLYAMDSEQRVVYCLSRSNGNVLTMLENCIVFQESTPGLSMFALSGSYMLVCRADGRLALCRVID